MNKKNIIFNKYSSIFLTIISLELFLFANSDGNLLNQINSDIERFVSLENFKLDILLFIFFFSLFIIGILLLAKNNFEFSNEYLLFIGIFTVSQFLVFYLLRIYVSRFYILIVILLFLILLKILEIKEYKFGLFISIPIFLISIFMNNSINFGSNEIPLCSNQPFYFDTECIEEQEKVIKYGEQYDSDNYVQFNNSRIGNYKVNYNYELTKYSICCEEYNYDSIGGKPTGYIDLFDENLIFLNGSGYLFYVNESEFNNENFKFEEINSNLTSLINNQLIFESQHINYGWESVRDLLILNDKIFISLVEEPENNCANVEVFIADMNLEFLNFERLFSPKECIPRNSSIGYVPFGAGGKMSYYKNNEIFLTIGDFLNYEKAQDSSSVYGKIMQINYVDKTFKTISLGHRNPQGLFFDQITNQLIETEHGPQGGDEINLIDLDNTLNYGWPVSSYGNHYDGKARDDAPLYKSHIEYGFEEPIYYFDYEVVGSHGISAIEKFNEDEFLVGTLNGKVLYKISFNFGENSINEIETFKINERIRDLKFSEKNKVMYLVLENTPAIGILKNELQINK
jgi:hypothetical protein